METPEHRVQFMPAASVQLGQYLHALPTASWSWPGACDRWEVRDVVGHLILGAESTLMSSLVLLLYGRLPLPDAIAAGHITAEGATALISSFAQWFRGM